MGDCIVASQNLFKKQACNIVRWADKLCYWRKHCRKLPWPLNRIACKWSKDACHWVKREKEDCSSASKYSGSWKDAITNCVEDSFQFLTKCGISVPSRKRMRRSLAMQLVLVSAGLNFGAGVEVGAGVTFMAHAWSWGVGFVITGDNYAIAYTTAEKGHQSDLGEGQVYIAELAGIPKKDCFLGHGQLFGAGFSFWDIFGVSLFHSRCYDGRHDKGHAVAFGKSMSVGIGALPIEFYHYRTYAKSFWEQKF